MPANLADDERLRAKYHDWCSARIVEQFLSLSPEEVYELARPGEAGVVADMPVSGVSSSPPAVLLRGLFSDSDAPAPEASFQQLVQRVTEALLERTDLPSFEEWSTAYGEDPSRFDAEMLGFWESPESGAS